MTITIEATYEDGVLKPSGPLPLSEHEKVQVTNGTVVSLSARRLGWGGTKNFCIFRSPENGI